MSVEQCRKCGELVRIYGRTEWHVCYPRPWVKRLIAWAAARLLGGGE